ncbi:glycerophosphodiester phosphodiesterase family protein [Qipengyuania marisflavi]|uniref:GP-PDE domain-containing protein n=1 Tax=Qipengyuania marisflavi TaxID=2486356 RepID=A0A5S3P5F3_9SPHN|nr:glycerophosphodiester phosphodiesterase family protein [Qipengyuania marisflavi]TMM48051.1 hypothetical protein FEV51_07015 [Qipengyuania marisflavi]
MPSAIDRLFVPAPDPARVGWLRDWTYAHRGLHRPGIPENSLAAYSGAIAAGLGIECDIQRSRDGHAMLIHDWELDRLTGVSGQLADYTSDQLAQIAFLEAGHGIARLEDLLDLAAGKVPILIEIKSRVGYDVEHSCRAVRDALASYAGLNAVMSFDPRVARWFCRYSPQTVRGLVMREDDVGFTPHAWQRRLALWAARPEFIAYHIAAVPNPMVTGLRAHGLPVLTWTVSSQEMLARAQKFADAPIAEDAGIA